MFPYRKQCSFTCSFRVIPIIKSRGRNYLMFNNSLIVINVTTIVEQLFSKIFYFFVIKLLLLTMVDIVSDKSLKHNLQ